MAVSVELAGRQDPGGGTTRKDSLRLLLLTSKHSR